MKIAISAESSIDMPKEMLDEFNIKVIPYNILLGDEVRVDGEVTPEEIISFVNKTGILPKTSAINEYQFTEHFSNLLKDYDKVIHFSMSSKLTSACNNAKSAAKKLGNVHVVDTKTLSSGIGLYAIYAAKLVNEGVKFEEIVKRCEKRVPYIQVGFVLEQLNYLYKGGRCSALALFGANLLRIKPQILLVDGEMRLDKKYRGSMDNVVKQYCIDMLERFPNPDLSEVFLTYTTATEKMREAARQVLTDRGFKNIRETRTGSTILSHSGEHCLGILYFNDGGEVK